LFLTTILYIGYVEFVVFVSIPLPLPLFFLSDIGSRSGQMLISAEKGEILIPQSPLSSESVVPLVYTDVNVVPEHESNQLEKSISNLEEEVFELKLKLKSLDEKRKQVLNKIIDTKGSIRVFCRVRPFLLTERRPIREPVSFGPDNVVIRSAGSSKEFEFDKVFHQSATQVVSK